MSNSKVALSAGGGAGSGTASRPRTAAITRFTWLSASAAVANRVARSATPTVSRSWAAMAGQAASRSLRCRSAHPKQLVTPGMTSGPTRPVPSRTRTARCGTPWLCRSRTMRGSATR